MAEGGYDVAVCGSTPFAGLLAGLLATAHGKRVCLVGDRPSPYRLARGVDVSVMPATRPETWQLLRHSNAETLKLLNSIGRGLYERVDPLFVADLQESADYLGHMRWMALGLGFAAERTVERTITTDGTIVRIRDAAMLVAGRIEPAVAAWLDKAGVDHMAAGETTVALRKDGGAMLRRGSEQAEAQMLVLADDEAILSRLPQNDRHRLLTVAPRTSLLADAQKPLPAALVAYLDRDTLVHQRAGKGPITAIAAGDPDGALPRIGACLAAQGRLDRAGQARFLAVGTRDGAPLVGRMGRSRVMVLAGLGPVAAFLAPVMARVLAGVAGENEQHYFEARTVSRAATRAHVAEADPAAALETVS